MHPRLQAFYKQLEDQRVEFSAWVENAPKEKQHTKPAVDQWSAAQVLFHLGKVDEQVILSMQKRLASEKPLKARKLGTRFRSFLLNLALRLPLKFKAPAEVREVPEEVAVQEVIQQWKKNRERLFSLLSSYSEAQLNKEVFFHPRSGMITMLQTLRFLVEHTEHHRKQMQRLLS